jgi:hypothetical protein
MVMLYCGLYKDILIFVDGLIMAGIFALNAIVLFSVTLFLNSLL